jgi:hypothetical protein
MEKKNRSSYVEKMNAETLDYIRDLTNANRELRFRVAALERELDARTGEFEKAQDLICKNTDLRTVVNSLEQYVNELEGNRAVLKEELDGYRRDLERLRSQMSQIETENREFAERCALIGQHHQNLMNLYVASYRMHGTLDRSEVLDAIRETVVDLVGSEDFAVFELEPGASTLSLLTSAGIDEGLFEAIPIGSRPIGESALKDEISSARKANGQSAVPGEEGLTAFIPLRVDGQLMGAIAIFSLLPQKGDLEEVDHELFELLASHAATALFCTRLRADFGEAAEAAG